MSTTTFSITIDDLSTAVLRLQGIIGEGETPSTTKLANMQQAANLFFKQWAANEIKLWTVEELVLTAPTLVSGQAKYSIGSSGADLTANRPLRIIECFQRNTSGSPPANTDVTLQRLSRQEYLMLGNKASTGTPNSFYYDPQLPNGNLYLYVTPDTSAVSFEVHVFSQRQIFDLSAGTDTVDFPQEWFNPVKWGLADETALENQCPLEVADRITARAKMYKEAIQDWDVEDASVYFQPDTLRMGR